MNRQPKILMSEFLRKALADLGAEPLEGSGLEDETAEVGYASGRIVASTSPGLIGLPPCTSTSRTVPEAEDRICQRVVVGGDEGIVADTSHTPETC